MRRSILFLILTLLAGALTYGLLALIGSLH